MPTQSIIAVRNDDRITDVRLTTLHVTAAVQVAMTPSIAHGTMSLNNYTAKYKNYQLKIYT